MKVIPANFFENRTKVLLALILPAFIVYVKSLNFDFTTLDEQWMIVRNVAVLEKPGSFLTAFTQPLAELYYRPLLLVTFLVDYRLGKLFPFIYHLTNLAWHLLSVVLLYRFLALSGVGKKTAFICSLIFSIHPITVHAVVWIPGRNDLMLCAFTLTSLIYLKKFIDTQQKKFILLHFLFFVCALFTKENAGVLPLIFIAYYFIYKNPQNKKLYLILTLWLVTVFSWLFLRQRIVLSSFSAGNDPATDIKNFISGFLLFTGKAVFPIQQSVFPTLQNSSIIPGILILIVLIVLCFKPGLKNVKIAFFGLFLFFIIAALPVWFGATKSGSEHYEHRIYTSVTGLVLFFTQIKFTSNSKIVMFISGLIISFFFIKTSLRMNVYKNDLSFVETGIQECPDYYLFYLQKGDILNHKNDFITALDYYNKTLSLRPGYGPAHSNRGLAYYGLGMYKEALEDYKKAIELSAFDPKKYVNRCMAYHQLGDIKNAMKDLIVLKKSDTSAMPAGLEKEVTDKWILMLENLEKQAGSEVRNASLYYECALMYFDIEMNKEGLVNLKRACFLEPGNTGYQNLLKQKLQATKK